MEIRRFRVYNAGMTVIFCLSQHTADIFVYFIGWSITLYINKGVRTKIPNSVLRKQQNLEHNNADEISKIIKYVQREHREKHVVHNNNNNNIKKKASFKSYNIFFFEEGAR